MSLTRLFGGLLGLREVDSIERIEFSLAAPWAQAAPWAVWLGCFALLVGAAAFYARWQPERARAVRLILTAGRSLVLCAVLLFLAEPTWIVHLTSHPRPLLWFLFDGTDSMAIEDDLAESDRARLHEALGLPKPNSSQRAESLPTRVDYVKALVSKRDRNVLDGLGQRFRLRAFQFDRPDGVSALKLNSQEGDDIDAAALAAELSTGGQVTAIGAALTDLSQRHATSQLAGLVIVSDFDQNAGPAPLAAARSLGVPIYTIGVGPAAAVDLAVDLQAPPLMKKGERSTLSATLRQNGLDGRIVNVRLTARRLGGMSPDATPTTIGEQSVSLASPTQTVEFAHTPNETGRFAFVAEVDVQEGEVVRENNRAERESNIRDDFLRLMFVEYEPTWEWRFIKEVFHRDQLVGMRGFRTFLRSADPKVRQTNELFLPTMTPQRSDFFANDVIFLGDMPASTLGTRFCELVKEFVSQFGGGLVVLSGPAYGPSQLAGTPLADMLPVVVDADARIRDSKDFAPRLTPQAGQIDFMQLGAGEAENRRAWGNLGRLPWYQPVARVHPLSTVLLEHPTDTCVDGRTPQPLVAIRRYGRGEVVYLAFDETWRLRRKYGEGYYRQFWGQMIHRLGLSHALGTQKRFVVRTDRQQYQSDEKVLLTVEAYDENFEPLSEAKLPEHKLTAELILPDKSGTAASRSVSTANPLPGDSDDHREPINVPQLREGVFEARIPVFAGGEHRVRVLDPVSGEHTEVTFMVTSLSAERRSAVRNVALEEELAYVSGGKNYDLTTAGRLVDDVKTQTKTESSIVVFPLWNTWLGFGLVVGVLLAEWIARKLVNLP